MDGRGWRQEEGKKNRRGSGGGGGGEGGKVEGDGVCRGDEIGTRGGGGTVEE